MNAATLINHVDSWEWSTFERDVRTERLARLVGAWVDAQCAANRPLNAWEHVFLRRALGALENGSYRIALVLLRTAVEQKDEAERPAAPPPRTDPVGELRRAMGRVCQLARARGAD